jgi:hypothetical protein
MVVVPKRMTRLAEPYAEARVEEPRISPDRKGRTEAADIMWPPPRLPVNRCP